MWFMIRWTWLEKNKQEDMNKLINLLIKAHKVKMQMLPFITLRICLSDGMANQYLIGYISCMGWVSNINARSVVILVIGVAGHLKCISNSGDIHMAWNA